MSSKEGDLYVMGGLINSSTVKGDLWMIEAGGSLSCYPLATTAEGPGPRVGHASLLVGNAFIVYGGDTKIEENDSLDETLYLLNTCMLHALPRCSTSRVNGSNTDDPSSHTTVVAISAGWPAAVWSLWTHPQHTRVQDLHFRRPGRGHLHE